MCLQFQHVEGKHRIATPLRLHIAHSTAAWTTQWDPVSNTTTNRKKVTLSMISLDVFQQWDINYFCFGAIIIFTGVDHPRSGRPSPTGVNPGTVWGLSRMESSLEMSRGIRNACQREHQSSGFISSDSLGKRQLIVTCCNPSKVLLLQINARKI